MAEVTELLGTTSARVRPWFRSTEKYAPAICSPLADRGKIADIGFLDLIEVRFVDHFRKQGVTMQALRQAAAAARDEFGERPFARDNLRFRTDRRKIYAQVATDVGDTRLLNLAQERQFELDVIEASLQRGVDFDPTSALAIAWKPFPDRFKSIVLNPERNFGRPSLEKSGIGVEEIHDAWIAEGGDIQTIENWFDIESDEIDQAIRFSKEYLH
ncbi:MAG: DUF433 domain-containing protein [Pseudomonadota bacterium]|nr:DUF433 domain-containing protein [Pseudomonadota bacterium]